LTVYILREEPEDDDTLTPFEVSFKSFESLVFKLHDILSAGYTSILPGIAMQVYLYSG
jgi:hypothetical protein